jgi:hypothetical protein
MFTTTASRLAGFAAGLALIGGGAAALGAATHPTPPFQDCMRLALADAGVMRAMGGEQMVEPVRGADGLKTRLAGLELEPRTRTLPARASATWRFRIAGCDGKPVSDYTAENGKRLHLIVARSDLGVYQHLHPRLAPDGTWSVDIDTSRPGRYRAIADFVTRDRKFVLGTTLTVPGRATRSPLPAPSDQATVDGYAVELERPAVVRAGEEAQLTFRISRHGGPVTGLQPYLGAYGHLVALHAGNLAYSHVHPNGEDRHAGAITFDTELPTRGRYRLFLQFRAQDRVHTVGFTQSAS